MKQIQSSIMQQYQQAKQFNKLKQIRYRRLTLASGNTIVTYNSLGKVQPKGVFIEFPLIDNNCEENGYNPPIDRKMVEQEIVKKNNNKAVKTLMKIYAEDKRKDQEDFMNILGLDIKKINYVPPTQSKSRISKQSTNKIHIESSSRNFSLNSKTKANSRTQINRKNSQRSETIDKDTEQSKIKKLEMTESVFLYRQKKSVISDGFTISPTKEQRRKYLYEKLAGKELLMDFEVNLVYDRRIKSYTELLWKLQYAHNIYINLDLKPEQLNNKGRRVKYYVGPGNNSAMIKGLLKRRYWWISTDDKSQSSFTWTQIKVNEIFKKQKKGQISSITYNKQQNLDESQEQEELKNTDSFRKHKNRKARLDSLKMSQLPTKSFNSKILSPEDEKSYARYTKKYEKLQNSDKVKKKLYSFRTQKIEKVLRPQIEEYNMMHNHLENNFYLGNKKALFYNLKQYYGLIGEDPFEYIPLTFHIKKGMKDPEYKRFTTYYNRRKSLIKKQEKQEEESEQYEEKKKKTRNIWIVKPGENSNQGRGITVIDEIYELNNIIKRVGENVNVNVKNANANDKKQEDGEELNARTYIVQLYIDRPFLYNARKFDIRHYMLITNLFGITRAYWYLEGYIRTSSYEFNIHNFQPEIHLTNDAIQKKYPEYSRYEPYNKISYEQFQRYLQSNYSHKKYSFKDEILTEMKKMATDAAKSVYTKISPKNQLHNFEIFGLDFMIDRNFRPWLIEINTNPCLDCSCPLLDRIIPYMVEQSFKLSLDVVYPPPSHYPNTCKHYAPMINLETFKYELIFDSQFEGEALRKLYEKCKGNLINEIGEIEQDEQFKDDGREIKLDDFT